MTEHTATEFPSAGGREVQPTTLPPRAVPARSWVGNVGQWLFAYSVAWSVLYTAALLPTALRISAAWGDIAAVILGWILATVTAVATCDEPKESGSAVRRYAVAIAIAVPGLLIALLVGLTVFVLPALLLLGILGSPLMPWFHRGSPVWKRACLSALGLAAIGLLSFAMFLEPSTWPPVETWAALLVFGPFLAAGSATGALFALRNVGVPRQVG